MRSEKAALPIFDCIPCLETPRTRIQNCALRIGQCRAGPGPAAQFFELVCSMALCSPPRQLFSGWHFDPGSQSDNGMPCNIGNESARARFAFGPPCGASSWGRALIFSAHCFLCRTKTRLVRVQRVDRGRTHSMLHLPEPNATPWDLHEANPVSAT